MPVWLSDPPLPHIKSACQKKSVPNEDEQLREIFEATNFPSPDRYLRLAIFGLLTALALFYLSYSYSGPWSLALIPAGAVIGALSLLEHRIWRAMARRSFVTNAVRAGFSEEQAREFWRDYPDDEDGA